MFWRQGCKYFFRQNSVLMFSEYSLKLVKKRYLHIECKTTGSLSSLGTGVQRTDLKALLDLSLCDLFLSL